MKTEGFFVVFFRLSVSKRKSTPLIKQSTVWIDQSTTWFREFTSLIKEFI